MNPRVALFTLTYNRLEYTKRMFETLDKSTAYPFDHFVIDNGSTDGTIEFLQGKPGRVVKVIYNETNRGLSLGWNQALDVIGNAYDYIVKVDNDCELISFGWIETILDILESTGSNMILSPFVDGLSYPNQGGHPRYDYTEVNGHKIGLTHHLGGLCHFAPASVYQNFRFPEKAPKHGNQDVRLSAYVGAKLGYKMGYVEDIVVRHMDHTTGQHEKYPEYFKKRLEEKRQVYGENNLISVVLRPFRRLSLYRSMQKAHIKEVSFAKIVLNKLYRSNPLIKIINQEIIRKETIARESKSKDN